MTRLTIDFGIDLGTTNSSIAVLEKQGPRVMRNDDGWQFTPSAVWIDKNGAIKVGLAAKDRLVNDPDNSAAEFKLWMGKTQTKKLARINRVLSPEELSAEVLKSLKGDVKKATGEDIEAAVITVPAAFDQPESEATRRAATLAGIQTSPLLQEPVAAALAYGFQSEHENVFWLVYDMGGGTFDAAVIHVREGTIQIVNHGGDNDLGGKLIDWAIVDQLFVPQLLKTHRLASFRRGNPKWYGAFAKLKHHAEKIKIALSKDESFDVPDEFICVDDDGNPVQLDCSVTRAQVESLFRPYLAKSINICKRVLAEKRLSPHNIEKVLLVGGPTYTPYLRMLLADKREGLGIPLEFGVDPLTVVAQGAALFAGSQRLSRVGAATEPGKFTLQLEYKPIGSETEPLVGGRVLAPDRKTFAGFSIRFTNSDSRPPWNSGNIRLQDNGTFMATLWADKQQQNVFTIELFDPSGRKCPVSPDSIHYTVGLVITDPPLPHNIGVAMANNEVDVFFEKGTPLPAKRKQVHQTVVALKRGNPEGRIRIPFVEGDHSQADLNRKIGFFEIRADQVGRDVPVGSEFEIKLELDTSRLVRGSIYVPILDMEFPLNMEGLVKPQPDVSEMRKEFENQKQKLQAVQEVLSQANSPTLVEAMRELKREEAIGLIETSLASADDAEAARTCEKQLLDLKAALRKIEAQVRLPKLLAEAKDEIEWARQAVDANGTSEEQARYQLLKQELEAALHGDAATLEKKIANLFQFRVGILARTPEYWIGYRDYLLDRQAEMSDPAQAQLWFSHADRAINNGDVEALKSACNQLRALLPLVDERRGYGGTTVRSRGVH